MNKYLLIFSIFIVSSGCNKGIDYTPSKDLEISGASNGNGNNAKCLPYHITYYYEYENKIVDLMKFYYNENSSIDKVIGFGLYAVNGTAISAPTNLTTVYYNKWGYPTFYENFVRISYYDSTNKKTNSNYIYYNREQKIDRSITDLLLSERRDTSNYIYSCSDLTALEMPDGKHIIKFSATSNSITATTINIIDQTELAKEIRYYDLTIKNPTADVYRKPNFELLNKIFHINYSSYFSLLGKDSKFNLHSSSFETRRESYVNNQLISVRENIPEQLNVKRFPQKITRRLTVYANNIPGEPVSTIYYINYQNSILN